MTEPRRAPCRNCGRTIEYQSFIGAWRHVDTRSAYCSERATKKARP